MYTLKVPQESSRSGGRIGFINDREVLTWSTNDFNFSYTVSSVENFGGLLLKSSSRHDFDQGNMFCFYLYPPHDILGKAPRQPDDVQCRFYIMAYMKHIIEDAFGDPGSIQSIFANANYSREDIDQVRTEWVDSVSDLMEG